MALEKLTVMDRNLITQFIKEYCDHSNCNWDEFDLNHILRFWDAKKNTLLKLLGGELMFSKKVTYQMEDSELWSTFTAACYDRSDSPMFPFTHALESLAHRLDEENRCNFYRLMALIHPRSLIDNKVDFGYHFCGDVKEFEVPLPNGSILKIPHGCKPMKFLGKIAKAYDLDGFEEFRIEHSRLLNQKTLTGNLVISIHPLDFMTMSTNDCNWRSCMAWPDGEYKQGTVEMMNSPCVVVAYLESKTPWHPFHWDFTEETWSNKKWRELFIITPQVISDVCPYPYDNIFLSQEVLKILRDLAKENMGWTYRDDMILAKPNVEEDYRFFLNCETNETIYLHFETDCMYNDTLYNDGYAIISDQIFPDEINEINIYQNYSGVSECMCCGDTGPCSDEVLCWQCMREDQKQKYPDPPASAIGTGELMNRLAASYDSISKEYRLFEGAYDLLDHIVESIWGERCDAPELYETFVDARDLP